MNPKNKSTSTSLEEMFQMIKDLQDEINNNKIFDSGWLDFSWTDDEYVGTAQSSYCDNRWRVKNDILYITCGVGRDGQKIDTSSEFVFAHIPIRNNTSFDTSGRRFWNVGVGTSGAVSGFKVMQAIDHIEIGLKPHTQSSYPAGYWYSTHFSIPLDRNWEVSNGNLSDNNIKRLVLYNYSGKSESNSYYVSIDGHEGSIGETAICALRESTTTRVVKWYSVDLYRLRVTERE